MLAITKDAWIPIPAEFRRWGAPPPTHYIDALMRHLGHTYYVGFLSAAQLHGAAHQAPMTFQIVSSAVIRDRKIGRSQLEFIRREHARERPTAKLTTPTGRITVSTPEVTMLDLAESPSRGGGLSNVATIAAELLSNETLSKKRFAAAASTYPLAVVQRLGFLLERAASHADVVLELDALAMLVESCEAVALDPRSPSKGERDRRWNVIMNNDVEIDE